MNYEFAPSKLEIKYTDVRYLKKHFGPQICDGMIKFLAALEYSLNMYDFATMFPYFYLEHLKGNMINYYSITLDKKKSKWRLILQLLNEFDEVVVPLDKEIIFLKSIKKIRIKELSEHYVEY